MPIPSRLAGLPEAIQWGLNRSRGNAAEQRAAERHAAWMQDRNRTSPSELRSRERHDIWRQNYDTALAQDAAAKQQQASALSRFEDPNNPYMAIFAGQRELPNMVQNPNFIADVLPGNPHRGMEGATPDVVMNEYINKGNRAVTPEEIYNTQKLYSQAQGTNMPGGSALARILAAGTGDDPDAQEPFVESRWNATIGEGGIPFGAKQREGYQAQASDAITAAMIEAQAKPDGGMAGVFDAAQVDNIDDVRRVIMQDAWTVARKIARDSVLIDEGTAFNQIIDAMARGKISPIQIKQLVGEDAVVGDEGLPGYWTTNKRGLQAAPTPREQLRAEWEKEYGKSKAAAQGVGPIIQ